MSNTGADQTPGQKPSSPSVDPAPDQFENMKTIDVVRTIMGVYVPTPEPFQVLPPGDPNNPKGDERLWIY